MINRKDLLIYFVDKIFFQIFQSFSKIFLNAVSNSG